MNTGIVRTVLMVAGVLGLGVVARMSVWPLAAIEVPVTRGSTSASADGDAVRGLNADSQAVLVTRDPFRIGRRAVLPAYDPLRLAEQLAPPPPRPALLLVGVVEGTQPSAIVEGFPGIEGSRVVRVGDVIAGLAIKKVSGGRVTIVGMDTTWVLEVREPWKN